MFDHHRRRQVVACALLRQLLGRHTGRPPDQLSWQRGPQGKPYLPSGPHFNLSHSEGYAVLALDEHGELGVDLEDSRRRVEFLALARRFFSAPEANQVQASADPRRLFFQIWTAKEAYIKALGSGLSHPLDQFTTCCPQRGWGLYDLSGQRLDWELHRLHSPYAEVEAALVRRGQGPPRLESVEVLPGGQWRSFPKCRR
jgi:4'-phosphopantetheinyl transferase